MNSLEQKFLNDLDDKLWKAADKLRSSLDAANYKHIVLGLIFLKYVSDAFDERQLKDEETDFLLTEVASSADFIKISGLNQEEVVEVADSYSGQRYFAWSGRSAIIYRLESK